MPPPKRDADVRARGDFDRRTGFVNRSVQRGRLNAHQLAAPVTWQKTRAKQQPASVPPDAGDDRQPFFGRLTQCLVTLLRSKLQRNAHASTSDGIIVGLD